ncbi:5-formyltetrahydrofolate cyclo-ligase [Peribacillus sp. SCS-37]|uniref:5-formyltetrahydrofolate cyclo-ligase n=1 Tax=Paraperibacillus esterisolvens TaxID=3115296 RepID=UPI003906A5D2
MDKKRTRQMVKALLKEKLTREDHQHQSEEIRKRLFGEDFWSEARCIGITLSNFPEADTIEIIRKAWDTGKAVAVPKCIPDARQLDFRLLQSFDELETVFYGLKEPIPGLTTPVAAEDIDLMFVPGLAFDARGYRLGYGGGYYDRLLAGCSGLTVSLALDLQILDSVPKEVHDMPVSTIITPGRMIVCDI